MRKYICDRCESMLDERNMTSIHIGMTGIKIGDLPRGEEIAPWTYQYHLCPECGEKISTALQKAFE